MKNYTTITVLVEQNGGAATIACKKKTTRTMKQLQATVAMQLQQEETEPLMLMVINQEEK